jgi:hypothetical protein
MVPLKAIDVAIGIAFLYLLLTFGASAAVEMFSSARNWRAQMLHDAIENMLGKNSLLTVDDIYKNPLVLALCRQKAAYSPLDLVEPFGWRPFKCSGGPPSYIPPATFSGAVLESLMNKEELKIDDLSPDGAIQLIRRLLSKQVATQCACDSPFSNKDALRSVLKTTLATQGASIQAVRFAVEKWFSDTMDRTSGWYKRRTQACLLIIGLVIAFGYNLNTIAVVRWLWESEAARQAAVAAAGDFVRNNPTPQQIPLLEPGKAGKLAQTSDGNRAAVILQVDKEINRLQYPIGWKAAVIKDGWRSWILEYLLGALITALAISMGSTFWFDAVQSLIKIRGTGPKPVSR